MRLSRTPPQKKTLKMKTPWRPILIIPLLSFLIKIAARRKYQDQDARALSSLFTLKTGLLVLVKRTGHKMGTKAM
jgi:hypothetical protein